MIVREYIERAGSRIRKITDAFLIELFGGPGAYDGCRKATERNIAEQPTADQVRLVSSPIERYVSGS